MDKISIARWFEIMDGKIENLYKFSIIKWVPIKFVKIFEDMYYQLDKVDTTIIKEESEIAVLKSIAARFHDKRKEFHANQMQKKLNEKKKELSNNKTFKLNAFLNYIELTLNYQNIDPEKMKASRAFSLYNIAVDKNKEAEKRNNLENFRNGRNTK